MSAVDGTVVPEGRETLVVGLEVREEVLEGPFGERFAEVEVVHHYVRVCDYDVFLIPTSFFC